MTVTLYQMAPSFYSHLARLTLVEKGVDWVEHTVNIGPVMENYKPWYMRIHPMGQVPALDHDGTIVTEAYNIMKYVDQHFPGPALMPQDPAQREKVEVWLQRLQSFSMREFAYGLQVIPILKPLLGRSYKLRRKKLLHYMKENPDLADRYQKRLDDIDSWQKVSTNPEEVDRLIQQAESILDALEQELSHGKSWLLGEQYTLADVWLTIFLARLTQFGKNVWWEAGRRPAVDAYLQRLKARPSFAKADVWENIRPGFMLRMLAPFLLPRLAVAVTILGALSYGCWWLLHR